MNRLEITRASAREIGQARGLLERSRSQPYRFLSAQLAGELTTAWLDEIAELCEKDRGEVFLAARRAGEVVGMVVYSDLPWDTKVLGRAMGAVRHVVADPDLAEGRAVVGQMLDRTAEAARSRGIEFLLCKTYTDDMPTIHALEENGFRLMDTLLDYVYDARRHPLDEVPRPSLHPGFETRLAGGGDVDELVAVARACFRSHMGRFHADGAISRRQAMRVYEEWIRSALGGYGDWVFVAETGGRIAGYSVWRRPSPFEQAHRMRLGHYSIGAVHPDYAGRGLFGVLTYEGMRALDGAVDGIEGPTHVNNYAVQRAYARLRWRIRDARHSFHRWLAA